MASRRRAVAASITRRSCDPCRVRKIGCDRGSPCSNCVAGSLECTHSTRAPTSTPQTQRVSISSQYEEKIDNIVKDVSAIKASLQALGGERAFITNTTTPTSALQFEPNDVGETATSSPKKRQEPSFGGKQRMGISQWDHPVQITEFLKSVVGSDTSAEDDNETTSSLKSLLNAMSAPAIDIQQLSSPIQSGHLPLPPLEAVLPLLQWVKAHPNFHRIIWIGHILPVSMFEDICRKVYFAVDRYTAIDYILTAGFLSYMFSERRGLKNSEDHSQTCREAFSAALLKLPLILPPTIEVVAALLMATLYSIESSKSSIAWTYISLAASHCRTLRLHRPQLSSESESNVGYNLFMSVYKFEKGLSLRLGRPSGIRDAEVDLPPAVSQDRSTKIARIQGQIYDQLYSPGGLSNPVEREVLAREFAMEVKDVLRDIRSEVASPGETGDAMRSIYLEADLVCHTSILTSILLALPSSEYIIAAREVFDRHEQCMVRVRQSNDPSTMTRYLHWAILHVPFVPFSILFAQVVQHSDLADLDRLRRFAQSLKPDYTDDIEAPTTHPFRLYDLLYRTARQYVESGRQMATAWSSSAATGVNDFETTNGDFDPMFGASDTSIMELQEWFQGNQQLFHMLDEGAPF